MTTSTSLLDKYDKEFKPYVFEYKPTGVIQPEWIKFEWKEEEED